jgi:hypothetical protein
MRAPSKAFLHECLHQRRPHDEEVSVINRSSEMLFGRNLDPHSLTQVKATPLLGRERYGTGGTGDEIVYWQPGGAVAWTRRR